ncbi:MAG: ArnT family glycosyltransferase [Puniceicoccaceae bacterium]
MQVARDKALLLILASAALLRIIYLTEIIGSPGDCTHLNEQSDMAFFVEQAAYISDDDWLQDVSLHPYHEWHGVVANRYFATIGNDAPPATTAEEIEARNRALWDHWYGGKSYHQEPMYAYTLAVLFKVFGENNLSVVYILQSIIGLGSIFLVYSISQSLFSRKVAIVAGVLVTLYAPLLFFETILLRASFIAFASLLLVRLSIWARDKGTLKQWLILGVACGAAILLKSNLLLFFAGTIALMALEIPRQFKKTALIGGVMVAGFILALLPLIGRNMMVGVSPGRLSSVTPVTFLTTNIPGTTVTGFTPLDDGIVAGMGASDGKLLPILRGTLKSHTFGSYSDLVIRKLAGIFHWYEYPNNTNFYFHEKFSFVLRNLPVSTILILSLAIPGIFLSFRNLKQTSPLLLMILTHLATIILVFVSARFRLPLVVCAIPFAAVALVRFVDFAQAKQWKPLGFSVIAVLALILFIGRPLPEVRSKIRHADYYITLQKYYAPLADSVRQTGNWPGVVVVWNDFLSLQSTALKNLRANSIIESESLAEAAKLYARIYMFQADALERANQPEQAAAAKARAYELATAVANSFPEKQ